jgi:hypothetical protein
MADHQFRSTGAGRFIAGLVAVILIIAAGYFGYVFVMQWHRQAVEEAVASKEADCEERSERLRRLVRRLEKQLTGAVRANRLPDVKPEDEPKDRLQEVFGESEKETLRGLATIDTPDCFRLEKQIASFFDYLDRQGFLNAASVEAGGAREVFEQMLSSAAANPPLVVGETQDIVSLMHNQAHFFRLFDENRIRLVKYILQADADVLEHAMDNFYAYYVEKGGCGAETAAELSLGTLYEYAAFFLNTFSGKSYLLRRGSNVRCLVRYYSVLLLDKANQATLNRYGIDIRPHIELALDDIRHQKSLLYQDAYAKRLASLREKYM